MLTDSDAIADASRQMSEAAVRLSKMAPEVAQAKQVKEYDADRRKRLLSVLVVEQLDNGVKSAVEADHRARASASWGTALNDLSGQLQAAQRIIEEHNATMVRYEAARSILSMEKSKLHL